MRVMDLVALLKSNIAYTYYANSFPTTAVDDCATVKLTGGSTPNNNIGRPAFQVLIRSKNPAIAESKAYEIYAFF